MNYKKHVYQLVMIVILVVFSSCSQAEENMQEKDNNAVLIADFPKHVSKTVNEQVSVDADIIVPQELNTLSVNVYSAQKAVFGEESAYRIFFGDEPFASRKENSQKKNGLHSTFYTAEDGRTLLAGANVCSFQTSLSQYVRNIFVDNGVDPNYNVPRYTKQSELDFETKEGAFANIKEILSQLNIEVYNQYQCYIMPYDVMREESLKLKQNLPIAAGDYKTEWAKEEDCYLFRLNAYIEPLPIIYEDHGNPDDGTLVLGSTIEVIYSVNGVEYLLANSIYKQKSTEQENVNLISLDDALAKAETLVNSVIITGEIKIEEIKLQYIPLPADKNGMQFTLVPAWSFRVANTMPLENNETKTITTRYWIHVNAITGEEIV